ncbi:hypothetical protein BDV24DRAFT_166150 [Aspergillus arachidicola]|uniref:Uncharacterized protein n=1 Tax=Aspergillus arachidicola TaxID=656916 RepID=A0A5N6XZN7_9EURO|nr:hypothetical protein BDV24DRAFT_166150 [Aspergillus arachidicola]
MTRAARKAVVSADICGYRRYCQSVENAELQTSPNNIISSSDSKEEEELVEQPRGRIHNLQENQASSGASGKAASDSRETSHKVMLFWAHAPEPASGFHLEGRTASGPVSLSIVFIGVIGGICTIATLIVVGTRPLHRGLLKIGCLMSTCIVHKILISEDGDTVCITFAKPSSTDTPVEDAFLDIITYGPYHLDLKEEIEELCIVMHHALTPIIRELRKG